MIFDDDTVSQAANEIDWGLVKVIAFVFSFGLICWIGLTPF